MTFSDRYKRVRVENPQTKKMLLKSTYLQSQTLDIHSAEEYNIWVEEDYKKGKPRA